MIVLHQWSGLCCSVTQLCPTLCDPVDCTHQFYTQYQCICVNAHYCHIHKHSSRNFPTLFFPLSSEQHVFFCTLLWWSSCHPDLIMPVRTVCKNYMSHFTVIIVSFLTKWNLSLDVSRHCWKTVPASEWQT